MASKKTTKVLENFKSEFWRQVRANRAAWDVMNKIPGTKQNRVVELLGILSHPRVDGEMKEAGKEVNALLLQALFRPGPSRKEVRNLVRKLETLGGELSRVFGTGRVSFKRELFLEFAGDCRARARDLKYIDLARRMNPATTKPPRTLTYKAFWKHLPIAMLCRELEAPRSVSFGAIEELLGCAYSVRGRKGRPSRSVEREYKGFLRLKFSNQLKSMVWPHLVQSFLDECLAITSATK